MIPTVEQILIDLKAGTVTHEQAMAWMEEHFRMAQEEASAPVTETERTVDCPPCVEAGRAGSRCETCNAIVAHPAPLSASALTGETPRTRPSITEVVGADGKGVAAPCAISGCALMTGEAKHVRDIPSSSAPSGEPAPADKEIFAACRKHFGRILAANELGVFTAGYLAARSTLGTKGEKL